MLKAASRKGVAVATYILHSTQKSEKMANEKLQLAGKQGSSAAYFLLAHICEGDQDKSSEYFKLAAQLGHKFAQYVIGKNLVSTDKIAAVQWLGKAAIRGVPAAQILLGELLEEGVQGSEQCFQELISNGIDPTHVENGRFFKKHAGNIKKSIEDYRNLTDPLEAQGHLETISNLRNSIEKKLSKDV